VQPLSLEPVRDEEKAHPVADTWRPTFREIVKALAEGDYTLSRGIARVAPVSSAAAEQIRGYVTDYGETLTELPNDTWDTSVSQWMKTYWEVLVDLWTVESGQNDMVLHVPVFETSGGFRFEIDSVYVP
jgi:hypothetical protein